MISRSLLSRAGALALLVLFVLGLVWPNFLIILKPFWGFLVWYSGYANFVVDAILIGVGVWALLRWSTKRKAGERFYIVLVVVSAALLVAVDAVPLLPPRLRAGIAPIIMPLDVILPLTLCGALCMVGRRKDQ